MVNIYRFVQDYREVMPIIPSSFLPTVPIELLVDLQVLIHGITFLGVFKSMTNNSDIIREDRDFDEK